MSDRETQEGPQQGKLCAKIPDKHDRLSHGNEILLQYTHPRILMDNSIERLVIRPLPATYLNTFIVNFYQINSYINKCICHCTKSLVINTELDYKRFVSTHLIFSAINLPLSAKVQLELPDNLLIFFQKAFFSLSSVKTSGLFYSITSYSTIECYKVMNE